MIRVDPSGHALRKPDQAFLFAGREKAELNSFRVPEADRFRVDELSLHISSVPEFSNFYAAHR